MKLKAISMTPYKGKCNVAARDVIEFKIFVAHRTFGVVRWLST